jgi:hypothetical protein
MEFTGYCCDSNTCAHVVEQANAPLDNMVETATAILKPYPTVNHS